MGAATITDGSEYRGVIPGPGFSMHVYQVTTAANGEDGVTVEVPCNSIIAAFVSSNEDDMIAISAAVSWSGTTVTVSVTAGATGDAAKVSLMVLAVG